MEEAEPVTHVQRASSTLAYPWAKSSLRPRDSLIFHCTLPPCIQPSTSTTNNSRLNAGQLANCVAGCALLRWLHCFTLGCAASSAVPVTANGVRGPRFPNSCPPVHMTAEKMRLLRRQLRSLLHRQLCSAARSASRSAAHSPARILLCSFLRKLHTARLSSPLSTHPCWSCPCRVASRVALCTAAMRGEG